MKTKLLRKIRRKYEVLEVVKPEGYFEVKYFDMGLVFKITGDSSFNYYSTKQIALDRLIQIVKRDYPKDRQKKGIYRKVWYNKNV